MSQHPGFDSACALLEKLQRDSDRLRQQVTPDDFFNFAVTAWHLRDWIDKDPLVPASIKTALPSVQAQTFIQICRDIANGSKHFTVTKYIPIVDQARSSAGYGVGRYGHGAYGVGETHIQVTLTDGAQYDALVIVAETLKAWQSLLSPRCT